MSHLVNKIVDGKHTRANVAILMSQLAEYSARGIPIPQTLCDALPQVCERLMQSNSPRVQAAGVKLMLAMLRHNVELVQTADKMTRLENGEATEQINIPIKLIEGIDPKLFADERGSNE